jgi:Rieske Fe-S protein
MRPAGPAAPESILWPREADGLMRRVPDPLTRRDFLNRASAGLAAAAAFPLLHSCAGEEIPPGIRVEYQDLPDGAHLIVMDGTVPVEIARDGEEIRARSLICTHQGCQVQWREDEQRYHCPCHEGVFDAEGAPLLGPPRESLREFVVTRREGFIHVDTSNPAGAE